MKKKPDKQKTKDKTKEIDFTQFSMDDIARKVLSTPPQPKIKKRKQKQKTGET